MWHVAQVARRAGIAPSDFRPLIPLARAAVREEKREQFVRNVAFSEPDEGPDDADFVGGVIVPLHLAPVLAVEPVKVGFEHGMKRTLRQGIGKIEHGDAV